MEMMMSSFVYLSDDLSKKIARIIGQEDPSENVQRSRPRVLVVDDQRLIADTIAEILEGAGFEVVATYDPWEALEAAAHSRPDHLLSDVLMPKMNGVELAVAIRKMYPSVKILLFSGQAGISEILIDARERGFEFELIPKPIHPLKLIERIKEQQ
jgi:CheY-like chemotaxis protein